jgi:PAS domain S-box-containing protein
MREIFRRVRRRLVPLTILAIVLGAYGFGAFEPAERALMDSRFRLLPRNATGDLTVVAIDSRSLQALNTWPWPRDFHARVIDRLLAAGAKRIVLDVDLSATTTPSADAVLAAALSRAQGRVILPVFAQRGTLGQHSRGISYSLPAPMFRRSAPLAAVNVFPGPDSLVREYSPVVVYDHVPTASSAARLFGGLPALPGDFYLDFGIQPARLTSISYVDVLNGQFDPSLVSGKKVIIGATAVELGDQFAVPLHRTMAGPLLQALAYECLAQGRALHRSGILPTLGLALLVLLALERPLSASGWRRGLVLLFAVCAALYGVALALQAALPLSLDLAPALAAAVAAYAVGVLRELEQQALAALKHRMSDLHRRAMMQSVLEDSFDGIIIARADGTIELVNPAGSRLLGYAPESIVGRAIDHFLPGATLLQETAASQGDIGEPAAPHAPVERQLSRPDGTPMTVEHLASRSRLRIARNQRERRTADRDVFIHTFRDISERKTAEIKLHHAMQQALAANRAKSEFLANMSHELRTPLNAILGFSELIRDGRLEPVGARSRDYARDIHNSGEHLLTLISDVLDLAKIETGRFELHEEEVDLVDLVAGCLPIVEQRARKGGIDLGQSFAPDLPRIRIDKLRVKQILLNLLSNAIKFTPAGGSVTVSGGVAPEGGIAISISDTGIGIRPRDVPAALEPFRQLESTFNRRHEGTGLGLPLAKSLAELHGGTLEIDSEPGRGTTVVVRLPRDRVLCHGEQARLSPAAA